MGASRNMYFMGCRCPHVKGTFGGVWPTEKHCKAKEFDGLGAMYKNKWTDLNDLYVL